MSGQGLNSGLPLHYRRKWLLRAAEVPGARSAAGHTSEKTRFVSGERANAQMLALREEDPPWIYDSIAGRYEPIGRYGPIMTIRKRSEGLIRPSIPLTQKTRHAAGSLGTGP
jgi:hypothetical protein